MKAFTPLALVGTLLVSVTVAGQAPGQFVRLFNGKNLDGWVNVNTDPDTWKVRNGILICSGHPTHHGVAGWRDNRRAGCCRGEVRQAQCFAPSLM